MNHKRFAIKHIILIVMFIYTFVTCIVVLMGSYFFIRQSDEQLFVPNMKMAMWISMFVLWWFLVFVVGYIISKWLTRMITQPLEHLVKGVQHFHKKGDSYLLLKLENSYTEVENLKNVLVHAFSNVTKEMDRLQVQSNLDPLTGISNRRVVDEILGEWIEQYKQFSIVMIDIDDFKAVNDNYGHTIGDLVLKFFVDQINKVIRSEDISCRYAGDEFLILLPGTSTDEAYVLTEKLRTVMAITNSPCSYPITLSAGVATFPNTALTLEKLLINADKALYKAKNKGRNCVQIAE